VSDRGLRPKAALYAPMLAASTLTAFDRHPRSPNEHVQRMYPPRNAWDTETIAMSRCSFRKPAGGENDTALGIALHHWHIRGRALRRFRVSRLTQNA
jgi:hypothetical protein